MRILKNQEGSIIVMAVIIMVVISAIVFSVLYVLLNSLKSQTAIDNNTKAYYAAESGLERSLYTIEQARRNQDSLTSTMDYIAANYQNQPLGNQTQYSMIGVMPFRYNISQPLPQMQSAAVNYYSPDDYTTSVVKNASHVDISWTPSSGCQVEVTVNRWHTGLWPEDPNLENIVYKTIATASPHLEPLDSGWFYQVRARPLDCDLSNIAIASAEDNPPNDPVPIYGLITLTSLGRAGKSQQALVARTTWDPPVYSLYDFALFSECDIVKENNPTVNCP